MQEEQFSSWLQSANSWPTAEKVSRGETVRKKQAGVKQLEESKISCYTSSFTTNQHGRNRKKSLFRSLFRLKCPQGIGSKLIGKHQMAFIKTWFNPCFTTESGKENYCIKYRFETNIVWTSKFSGDYNILLGWVCQQDQVIVKNSGAYWFGGNKKCT